MPDNTETGTAVATATPAPKALDTSSPAVKARFMEAFGAGRLDKLDAKQQTAFLLALGDHIGLRAELGELMLYQGKPYVTLDGRMRLAHASGLLTGLETRPATQLERKNFHASEDEEVWVSDAYRRGAHRSFRGWGAAGGAADRNPVSKTHPRQMARKRSRYDAIRSAFPVLEEITQLHAGYIEEAERAAAEQRGRTQPLLQAAYGDAPNGDDPTDAREGDEIASVAGDAPDRLSPAQEAREIGVARVLELLSAPHVSDANRERIEGILKTAPALKVLDGLVAALEAGLPKTSAAPNGGSAAGNGSGAAAGESEGDDDPTLPLEDKRPRRLSPQEAGR